MKRAAVLGASGYIGRELQRLLARHPALELHVFASAREGLAAEAPELESEPLVEPLDWQRVAECDGVFLCTPHGASAPLARRCLELGKHVVDLSADFRFPDAALYRQHYACEHPAPELLEGAVYGLTELVRERLHGARLVANPGCYPTSILLPLKPLLGAGLVDTSETIVCDSKSGVSGAGKTPSTRTLFGNSHENFLAYSLGNHRHQPEIRLHAGTERLVFVPHLLPLFRGILSTIYLAPSAGATPETLRECLREAYAGERFVRVFERGLPELRGVQNTNECHVAIGECGDRIVIVSVIDNLLKGASGQALQNMNLALGLEEAAGLA
jgi:N-acetyl-gamma-glutamyl-phosphate reductase